MEILLTAFYNKAVTCKVFLGEANCNIGYLIASNLNTALLNITARNLSGT